MGYRYKRPPMAVPRPSPEKVRQWFNDHLRAHYWWFCVAGIGVQDAILVIHAYDIDAAREWLRVGSDVWFDHKVSVADKPVARPS